MFLLTHTWNRVGLYRVLGILPVIKVIHEEDSSVTLERMKLTSCFVRVLPIHLLVYMLLFGTQSYAFLVSDFDHLWDYCMNIINASNKTVTDMLTGSVLILFLLAMYWTFFLFTFVKVKDFQSLLDAFDSVSDEIIVCPLKIRLVNTSHYWCFG